MLAKGKHSRWFPALFVCLMTLLLTACGNNQGFSGYDKNVPTPTVVGTPQAPYDQQVYHMPIVGTDLDIATFDPALANDVSSSTAVSMNFNGLVRFDNNLQVQPELAQSWERSADGLQWTFHLRPHLTFSDGTPLTAQDVAYSIDRTLQPATKSNIALTYLSLIMNADKLNQDKIKTLIGTSILVPDASTVVFRLVKKAAYFLYTLTYPTAYVVEKHLIDKYGNGKFTDHLTEGGGAGPFVMSKYIHKQEIDFVPNPYYYNFKPTFQKVVILFYATPDMAYSAYQAGQLDITSVPPDRLAEATQLSSEFTQTPRLLTRYIAMNFLAKPFDNLHIRQAFALSINRDILNQVYNGANIPTYHIIPQGMIGYRGVGLVGPAGVQDTRGNASVAKQLLEVGLHEEGWSDVSQIPSIKLTYGKSPAYDKLVTAEIGMWKSVLNVSVIPDPIDFNSLLTKLDATNNNPQGLQMWMIGWSSDYPDPQDWTTVLFGKGVSENHMNYGQNSSADAFQEQAVQQQLEQADTETDVATRLGLYQTAEQQLVNQVAWIPLLQYRALTLLKPYMQGLAFNSLGVTPPTEWANIYIAAH